MPRSSSHKGISPKLHLTRGDKSEGKQNLLGALKLWFSSTEIGKEAGDVQDGEGMMTEKAYPRSHEGRNWRGGDERRKRGFGPVPGFVSWRALWWGCVSHCILLPAKVTTKVTELEQGHMHTNGYSNVLWANKDREQYHTMPGRRSHFSSPSRKTIISKITSLVTKGKK